VNALLADDERERALGFVRALLEPPTAPYAEDAQVDVVRAFVAARANFTLAEDEHANVVVTWEGSGAGSRSKRRAIAPGSVLAYSAHLDHPGFLYAEKRKGKHRAVFHGDVPERYFAGAPVRFHDVATRAALARAEVESVAREGDDLVATLRSFEGVARPGLFGVFDLTPGRITGRRLHARVCDDLLGAAAILCTLDRLARAAHPARVVGIFTRAEETGFVGCQGLLRSGVLGPEIAVVGLECSPRRPTAKVGLGPVIRVGDRQSVFDPGLTHHLQEAAESLRERDPSFRCQRALMDGGSCESTAYNLWGVRAGALCLALGNYHNCGPNDRIAPEFVDWDDFEGLVALMTEAATSWNGGAGDAQAKMRSRLDRIWQREYNRLAASSRRIRAGSRSHAARESEPDDGDDVV
jgi:endoglucanase